MTGRADKGPVEVGTERKAGPKKAAARDVVSQAACEARAMTYFLAWQYHRRFLLDDRVRNGNGYGQESMITRSSILARTEAGECAMLADAGPRRRVKHR